MKILNFKKKEKTIEQERVKKPCKTCEFDIRNIGYNCYDECFTCGSKKQNWKKHKTKK